MKTEIKTLASFEQNNPLVTLQKVKQGYKIISPGNKPIGFIRRKSSKKGFYVIN